MKDPPPPPHLSPRTRFNWDPDRYDQKTETGWRWTPIRPNQPGVGTGRSRGFGFGCVGVLALIAIVLLVGLNAAGGSKSHPALRWNVHGQASTSSTVGGTDTVQVTITNNGTIWFAPAPANDLVLLLNAEDNWFLHHLINAPVGCTINRNLEGLECGEFAAGATRTFTVEGSPKDAGRFDFELDVADREGSNLLRPDGGSVTWSETVTS